MVKAAKMVFSRICRRVRLANILRICESGILPSLPWERRRLVISTMGRYLNGRAKRLLSPLQNLNLEFVVELDGQGPVIEPIAGQRQRDAERQARLIVELEDRARRDVEEVDGACRISDCQS